MNTKPIRKMTDKGEQNKWWLMNAKVWQLVGSSEDFMTLGDEDRMERVVE
jgi:hypothetical protein